MSGGTFCANTPDVFFTVVARLEFIKSVQF